MRPESSTRTVSGPAVATGGVILEIHEPDTLRPDTVVLHYEAFEFDNTATHGEAYTIEVTVTHAEGAWAVTKWRVLAESQPAYRSASGSSNPGSTSSPSSDPSSRPTCALPSRRYTVADRAAAWITHTIRPPAST